MFVFYSYYDGAMKRNRLILTALCPQILLTILPLLLVLVFKIDNVYLATIALLNPIVGTGDIFYTLLLLIKIPENAMVKTDTSKVFWKEKSLNTC